MALDKVTYVDDVTVIHADNLNDIQDEIIQNASDINGKVSKAGDTMTGNLEIDNTSPGEVLKNTAMDVTGSSYTTNNSIGFRLQDKNGKNVAIITDRYLANGSTGLWLTGWKTVNGSDTNNSLGLYVDKNGNRLVAIPDPAPWRSALGLTYAANNTYSSGTTIISGVVTNNAKRLLFIVTVDKSLENISTVTVTDLHGHTAGVAGVIDGNSAASDDLKNKSGYTVTATKINNNTVRIQIDKSTALTNATTATPFAFYGYFTLKFT